MRGAAIFDNISTTLGSRTSFKGNLKFKKSLRINGKFSGTIESDGILIIEEGAVVTAEVQVRSLLIGGTLEGNVTASERVEMLETGVIYGNIKAPSIKIAEGVKLEGRCDMLQAADNIDIFSAGVDQLKKTAQKVVL